MLQTDITSVLGIENVADHDSLPEDYEMVDAENDVEIGRGTSKVGRVKRSHSMVNDRVNLSYNVRRLQMVSVVRRGPTMVVSRGLERVRIRWYNVSVSRLIHIIP